MQRDPSIRLLRHHTAYRWYWFGQSISIIGSEITEFALPLVSVLALGSGAKGVSMVATAGMLPSLLFSLLIGHWLHRRDHRHMMLAANFVQAASLGIIPIAWWLDVLSIPMLAAIAFVTGTAGLVFGLAAFGYVPALVDEDDLPAANRAAQSTRTLAQVGGPGFAGLLVQAVGAPVAIAVDAVSYLVSAVGIAKGRPTHPPEIADDGERTPILAGMKLLLGNPYLRALTIHAALYNMFSQIVSLNLVVWAIRQQDVSTGSFGLALSAAGIGGLIGTVTALALSDRLGLGNAFAASLVLSCGVPLLLPIWPLTGVALAGLIAANMFVAGIGLGNANVYSLTLRQTVIPADYLVRSAGAYTQIMYGLIPVGSFLAGVIGDGWGSRTAIVVGALGMAASIIPMISPQMRTLRTGKDARAAVA